MPSVCPFPGATGSFNGAASAPLASGAALFNASAAASGQTPFSAGRPPSTARKSTKKVRKRGDLVATCQPCQPCRLQPTPFFCKAALAAFAAVFSLRLQTSFKYYRGRVLEYAAAMRAVMMPGSNQAKVFSLIKTTGGRLWNCWLQEPLGSQHSISTPA